MIETETIRSEGSPSATSTAATILVVDDDTSIRVVLNVYLATFGYRVLLASDGDLALQIAHEHPEIRLAILDVVMPGLCGAKLAQELTTAVPGIVIVFSSGHPAEAMSQLGIDIQAAHFLTKPCPPAELKRTLEEMLKTK